ncbi:hypothetical protein QIS99_10015 [Streptomyces sp. B-S-A8]|uniref:Uncharacterized protein n=1 Tax=Streptomyces solicavernae TaxID=3043614 RepID=A0ABT6RQ75_9ACTN|nr:hypothetical protein [Streptomyces sp. B-S-A8]MDI3386545.1 hypothetical protein [Streptomyces sp. B-S-A8]
MNATEDPPPQPELMHTPSEAAPAAVNAAKGLAIGCAALVGIPLLVVLGYIVTFMAQRATPEDYPTVTPETAAGRLTAASQEMYEVAGFDRTLPPGVERIAVSTENVLDSGFCYPGGLESIADESVDGAYSLHHRWGVPDVPKDQGLAALRRLREHLRNAGWTITDYGKEQRSDEWELRAEKGEDRRASFRWRADLGYFDAGAGSGCAYDPAWTVSDSGPPGEHLDPPTLTPGR